MQLRAHARIQTFRCITCIYSGCIHMVRSLHARSHLECAVIDTAPESCMHVSMFVLFSCHYLAIPVFVVAPSHVVSSGRSEQVARHPGHGCTGSHTCACPYTGSPEQLVAHATHARPRCCACTLAPCVCVRAYTLGTSCVIGPPAAESNEEMCGTVPAVEGYI